MLVPGTQIDRYELVAPVGEGGMAQVWIARSRGKHGFEKSFALKAIHARYADEPTFRTMFLDEARIVARIEHPNVAQVFDLGESREARAGLYLVMEYVDGESLASLLMTAGVREGGGATVPTAVALRIAADVCAGLHAAHSLADENGVPLGVVHRDISPQNVLVSIRGDVKVIDFGIAVARDRLGGDTPDGALKGKLHYMAPEQVRREQLGPFTDVFAAGAVLYRMLGGRAPFASGSDAATIHRLLDASAPPLLPSDVPASIQAVCARALAPEPTERYGSALAMKDALETLLVQQGATFASATKDVAAWVSANLSDRARERREHLHARTLVSATNPAPTVPELGAPVFGSVPPPPPVPVAPASEPPIAAGPTFSPAPIGAPLPSEEPPADPGFMDVRALVNRARSGSSSDLNAPVRAPSLPATNPSTNGTYGSPTNGAHGSAHGTGGASGVAIPQVPAPEAGGGVPSPPSPGASTGSSTSTKSPTKKGASSTERSAFWVKGAFVALGFVLLIALTLLLLPRIIRGRVVALAHDAGVELTIDEVGVGLGGVSLRGVTARPTHIGGVVMHADEIFSGATAREIRVHGGTLTVDASEGTADALLALYEQTRTTLAGTPDAPRHIALVSARATWNGVLGSGSQLQAGDINVQLDVRGPKSEDVRGNVGRFDVTTSRTVFGPWAASFEKTATMTRARLLFDPPVPDGPSALVVWGVTKTPQVTVNIPRTPLANLGIRPGDLGIPAEPSTEITAKIETDVTPQGRTEGKGHVELYRARLRGVSTPIDVKIDGSASGPLGKALDLEHTTVSFGPFTANVNGTITPHEGNFRLDAAFRTLPIACADLARAEAKKMGALAAIVQELAHTTGAARVTGSAQASGIVKYDTKTPDDATFTFTTKDGCGLSLFGR